MDSIEYLLKLDKKLGLYNSDCEEWLIRFENTIDYTFNNGCLIKGIYGNGDCFDEIDFNKPIKEGMRINMDFIPGLYIVIQDNKFIHGSTVIFDDYSQHIDEIKDFINCMYIISKSYIVFYYYYMRYCQYKTFKVKFSSIRDYLGVPDRFSGIFQGCYNGSPLHGKIYADKNQFEYFVNKECPTYVITSDTYISHADAPHPDCNWCAGECDVDDCGHIMLQYDDSESTVDTYRELIDHLELFKKNQIGNIVNDIFSYFDELLMIRKSSITKSARN